MFNVIFLHSSSVTGTFRATVTEALTTTGFRESDWPEALETEGLSRNPRN